MTTDDKMQLWLDKQSELQYKMPSPHPTVLYVNATEDDEGGSEEDRKAAIDFIHWNVTAATDELHELLGEIGWKPWAKSRHINWDAARGEWIDAMHFMANLALVLGLDDADEVIERYLGKHKKNEQRQTDGYDGVSTKCPGCHRALDDDAVGCRVIDPESAHDEYEELMSRYPMMVGKISAFIICSVNNGTYMRKAARA
jgi:hypothetical protein